MFKELVIYDKRLIKYNVTKIKTKIPKNTKEHAMFLGLCFLFLRLLEK